MTMQIESPVVTDLPVVRQEEYEPSIADKIQRVLYRLDHGEELTKGCLRRRDNFCVMGLFTDESGLGEWEPEAEDEFESVRPAVYVDQNKMQITYKEIFEYYGMKEQFKVEDLPASVLNRIRYKFPNTHDFLTLAYLNDNIFENADLNSILADVIRSGAVFE